MQISLATLSYNINNCYALLVNGYFAIIVKFTVPNYF